MIFNRRTIPGTYSRFDFPDLARPAQRRGRRPRQQRHAHLAGEKSSRAWPGFTAMIVVRATSKTAISIPGTDGCGCTTIPERVNDEVFIAMSKALNFIQSR